MKRAIVVVVDSMGCGALPDAKDYNDELTYRNKRRRVCQNI